MDISFRTIAYAIGFVVFAIVLNLVFSVKFSEEIRKSEFQKNLVTVADLRKDLECMALNVYREAAYEPIEGRIAVAQVTMNRVVHPDFPDDICGVVYQKSVIMKRVVCQFSWYCDSKHRNRPINQEAYNESYEVAKKVILEGFRLEKLEDALYYHADYVRPNWKLERIGKIGTHIFYRQHGGDHKKLSGI